MSQNIVIGAGPAGLTTALELSRRGASALVLESSSQVGGLSRTVGRDGYRFDIGGHRFYTKSARVEAIWHELLGDDFLVRSRLSRILYRGRFFDYPLRPFNALAGLGAIESARVLASYVRARLTPKGEEKSFEQWVVNRFGRRLFEIFFETYTEKVWGMPCSEISADWASQRIKNLDLGAAVRAALRGGPEQDGEVITTLIDRFHYPRLGPGMMWERCAERVAQAGSETRLEHRVTRLFHDGRRVRTIEVVGPDGAPRRMPVDQVVSSMPLRTLVSGLDPAPPEDVLAAARGLRYRDFLTVVLIIDRRDVFPDQWIYVHSPEVRVGRVQNFKNWSQEMVPDERRTSLGLEYFVHEGDDLWSAGDEELVALARSECAQLGLVRPAEVVDGFVVRAPKAYPVYDHDYGASLDRIRGYLGGLENLHAIGRNGQHRYNNQDHSMLTGVLAARNLLGEEHDLWSVNVEERYLEEVRRPAAVEERRVPRRLRAADEEREAEDALAVSSAR